MADAVEGSSVVEADVKGEQEEHQPADEKSVAEPAHGNDSASAIPDAGAEVANIVTLNESAEVSR
jgi:hypothetical protein